MYSNRAGFVQRLAKALVAMLPSRAGLMALTVGLEAAAVGPFAIKSNSLTNIPNNSSGSTQIPAENGPSDSGKHLVKVSGSGAEVLEDLQLVLGASNRHFNFKYRGKGVQSSWVSDHLLVKKGPIHYFLQHRSSTDVRTVSKLWLLVISCTFPFDFVVLLLMPSCLFKSVVLLLDSVQPCTLNSYCSYCGDVCANP